MSRGRALAPKPRIPAPPAAARTTGTTRARTDGTGAHGRAGIQFSFANLRIFSTEQEAALAKIHAAGHPPLRLQAKLEVGASDDPLEREADRVADRVMQMPGGASVPGSPVVAAPTDALQRKCEKCEEEDPDKVRRKAEGASAGGMVAPSVVHEVLASPGRPLDAETRAFMEPRFGHDFGRVRIHAGPAADEAARSVGARAFTVGEDVVVRASDLDTRTESGRRLLAHELTHVVQQSGGGATPSRAGTLSRASLSVQRECAPGPCPDKALNLDAVAPRWQIAEKCLQTEYARSHDGNTIGVNREWTMLSGQTEKERQGLDCLRPHFVGPSGMYPGEPDIWDFTSNTIYEITTRSGENARTARVANEVKLANQIASTADCGGNVFGTGDWTPDGPCYAVGNGVFLRASNNGQGVLVYQMMKEVSEQDLQKILALDNFRQLLKNQIEQTAGEHKAQERLINTPSAVGFAGYWTNQLFNSEVPPLAIWNTAEVAIDAAKMLLLTGDIKGATKQLVKARRAYLIAARRYWAWKNGIEGAGTKAQVAIGVVAVAAVLAVVAPEAIGAVAGESAGGVAATTSAAVRIAETVATADETFLAIEASSSEAEIMQAAEFEAEMEVFSTLTF